MRILKRAVVLSAASVLAAIGTTAAVGAAPASAATGPASVTQVPPNVSSRWAGYGIDEAKGAPAIFSAEWKVPAVSCNEPGTGWVSQWAGMYGPIPAASSTGGSWLEQVVTAEECDGQGGSPHYLAYWEVTNTDNNQDPVTFYLDGKGPPEPSVASNPYYIRTGFTFAPGNIIKGRIYHATPNVTSSQTFEIDLWNLSNSEHFYGDVVIDDSVPATSTDTQGVAVVEETYSYLPDFGTVPFSQVHIQFGNQSTSWSENEFTAYAFPLVGSPLPLTSESSLSNAVNGSFTVTWQYSCAPLSCLRTLLGPPLGSGSHGQDSCQ